MTLSNRGPPRYYYHYMAFRHLRGCIWRWLHSKRQPYDHMHSNLIFQVQYRIYFQLHDSVSHPTLKGMQSQSLRVWHEPHLSPYWYPSIYFQAWYLYEQNCSDVNNQVSYIITLRKSWPHFQKDVPSLSSFYIRDSHTNLHLLPIRLLCRSFDHREEDHICGKYTDYKFTQELITHVPDSYCYRQY